MKNKNIMYRFLYNCVFCLAFINFLIYWIYLFFSSERNNNNLIQTWDFPHALPGGNRKAIPLPQNNKNQRRNVYTKYLSHLSFIISTSLWVVLTLLIFFRIIQSNHFPLANFYEALIFLTWCLVTLNLIILFEPTSLRFRPNLDTNTNSLLFPTSQKTLPPENLHRPSFWGINQWNKIQFSVQKQVSGAILAPCILFILAFAQFNLEEKITPLVPALKSNWLLMHVSIMICSYTTFMVGGLLAFFLLIQTFYSYTQNIQTWSKRVGPFSRLQLSIPFNTKKRRRLDTITSEILMSSSGQSPSISTWESPPSLRLKETDNRSLQSSWEILNSYQENRWGSTQWLKQQALLKGNKSDNKNNNSGFFSFENILEGPYKMQKKNLYILLDNLSYRMMGIGFPLFTLGILSGAVWANEAWGSYWSWDIKEVGSFINWLLVALYFHCRYKNFISLSHTVAFISLMVLFFNFFGISLGIFGSSLHAYGAAS